MKKSRDRKNQETKIALKEKSTVNGCKRALNIAYASLVLRKKKEKRFIISFASLLEFSTTFKSFFRKTWLEVTLFTES